MMRRLPVRTPGAVPVGALQLDDFHLLRNSLCRLVWSESDGLPGLIIDRYGDSLVLQTLTLAMDQRKDLIVRALEGDSIIERNDAPVRRAEGMELRTGMLRGDPPDEVEIEVA